MTREPTTEGTASPIRCGWVTDDPLYLAYHDHEWGRPERGDRKLFEMLCLEGAQAGLSWITILRKRQGYLRAFDGFDPEVIARYDEAKVAELLADTGIVRNKLKIRSVIGNARAFLEMAESGPGFAEHLWSFVDGEPRQNAWDTLAEVPAFTPESNAMSKDLKRRGFKFVGSTICYAFMQATGMVNDHLTTCFCYPEARAASSPGAD